MNYIQTEIDGVWLIEPRVFSDERGYFMEAYKKEEFDANLYRTTSRNHLLVYCVDCTIKKENIVRRNWFVFLKEKCWTLPLICVSHRLRLESTSACCLVRKTRDNFSFPVVLLMALLS